MSEQFDPLVERLRDFVDVTDSAQNELDQCLRTARAYLESGIPVTFNQLAQELQDDIVVAVAADLYGQRDARNGVMAFGGDTIQPFRVSTDPLRAAWPKLRAAGVISRAVIA